VVAVASGVGVSEEATSIPYEPGKENLSTLILHTSQPYARTQQQPCAHQSRLLGGRRQWRQWVVCCVCDSHSPFPALLRAALECGRSTPSSSPQIHTPTPTTAARPRRRGDRGGRADRGSAMQPARVCGVRLRNVKRKGYYAHLSYFLLHFIYPSSYLFPSFSRTHRPLSHIGSYWACRTSGR